MIRSKTSKSNPPKLDQYARLLLPFIVRSIWIDLSVKYGEEKKEKKREKYETGNGGFFFFYCGLLGFFFFLIFNFCLVRKKT